MNALQPASMYVYGLTQGRRYRGGRALSKAGGLSPPTFTDKNGAPPPILPVRGILVLTVSNIALVVHLLQS